MSNNTAFIAISFHKKFKNIYDASIKPAVENNGLISLKANGEDMVLRDIYEDIAVKLASSKIVIIDISKICDENGDIINLNNVYYELGLANGIHKRCILLAQDIDIDVPFDLRRLSVITYDPDDLTALKDELTEKIAQALKEEPVKFFKDHEILTDEMKSEFNYLKQKSRKITINVCPPTADIFFNDKLLGQSPQIIHVNTEKTVRNTVSFAAPTRTEIHREITEEEIEKGEINEKLVEITDEDKNVRVANWLRYRNKDTRNPVLMRAISQYLRSLDTKEAIQESKNELNELLSIAPEWYLVNNQMGYVTKDMKYYKIATLMNPDSYIGYFNQACLLAKQRLYTDTIEMIKNIEKRDVLISYAFSTKGILTDTDFDDLKRDKEYGPIFVELGEEIDKKAEKIKQELGYDC